MCELELKRCCINVSSFFVTIEIIYIPIMFFIFISKIYFMNRNENYIITNKEINIDNTDKYRKYYILFYLFINDIV